MKRWLLLLLCLMLPMSALADEVAAQDIPLYQIEPANDMLYADGVIPAGTVYSVRGVAYPEEGTALADFFITSGPIQWGQVSFSFSDRTGLIVMNPGVILGERTFSEVEAAEAERRYAAYGNGYVFTSPEHDDLPHPMETALVLCESLTLRDAPQTSANALASLPYGTEITCTSSWHPGWLEATVNGQTGWVRREFVLLDPQYVTFNAETPVLAWPSPDAPWIGLLDAGTKAAVMGEYGGYTVISLRGASGFVP